MTFDVVLEGLQSLARGWGREREITKPQLELLSAGIAGLEKRLAEVASVAPRRRAAGLPEALELWRMAGGRLEGLPPNSVAALCGHPETATDVMFLRSLESQLPHLAQRTRFLASLVQSYAQQWRSFSAPKEVDKRMEGFMTRYQGRNLWLCTIRTEFPRLFSELAAMELAKQAITQAQSVSSRCGALGLDGASGLARQARVELARIWRTTFVSADRKHSEPVALALLRCLVNDVLCEEPPNEVFAALDAAILSDASDQSPQFRTDLRDRILKWADLGDPRLSSNGPSWSKLSRPGRDRFLSWLAQDSLTFFFEKILPSHSAGAERGFFWMTYLGQIADFRVALSQIDEFRLSRMQGVSPPEFSKTEHRSTSAFVMRLKGKRPLVVVEFSELGHAAYLYFAEEFDRSVGSLHVKKLGISLLKNASAAGRIVHREGWEDTTVALLAQCGIRR